jgi:hypothetical protein
MIRKTIKYGVVPVVVLMLVGGLLFGGDLFSYVRSSASSLRASVKESVPVRFELQRARDLLDEIVPQIRENVTVIAREEVEIEDLKGDIARCVRTLAEDEVRIHKLSSLLGTGETYFTISDRRYSRQAVKGELERRFERHKDAQGVLRGKRRILAAREKSLEAAIQVLDKARSQKDILASKIETLAAQHRLVKAASVGSRIQVDDSKLAQTERLISQIKKRLDVAERVLAHEGRFVEQIQVDVVDEKDLLTQVGEYFGRPVKGDALAADAGVARTPDGLD